MENQKIYYVYEYIDPRNNQPFYIGKGKGDRLNYHIKNLNDGYNPHKTNKIKKILSEGLEPIINIVVSGLTETESFEIESSLIIKFGRVDNKTGCLLNLTYGGEGQSGWIPGDDYRKKMSESTKGEKNGMFGRNHSDETKNKIREKAVGRKASEETKKKFSTDRVGSKNSFYGKKHKSETIDLIKSKKIGRFTGEKNFTAKTFIFIDPNGKVNTVKGGFAAFCEKNNLSIAKMKRNINKEVIGLPKKNPQSMTNESKNCIGWQIKLINEK
jgi:hypothetical protein